MSVNGSDQLIISTPANPKITRDYNDVLVYDICRKKYFCINASKKHELLQKGVNPSLKVIDNFSTKKTSNDVNIPITEESSSSVNISKDEQFGNSCEKRSVVHHSVSNVVVAESQKDNNNPVPKNISICHAAINDTLEEVSSSNNTFGAVGGSSFPPKSTMTATPKQTFSCHDCQNVFDNNYLRALHKCTALKSFECQPCSLSFPNNYSLYRHKQSICKFYMSEKTLEDRFFEKKLSSNNKLDTVGESNISNKSATTPTLSQVNICNVCHKVFDTRCLHKCTVLKSFECGSCKLSFPNIYAINRHSKEVHTNEKPCEASMLKEVSNSVIKVAVVQTSLTDESTTSSSKSKTFFCNFCQKVFDKYYLLALHSCTKTYECQSCNKTFPSYNRLKVHQQIHTGEKPYKCDLCTRAFFYPSSLIKHKKVHTGEKPFSCEICSKRFTQRTNLRTHIQNIHINKQRASKKNSKLKKNHVCNFCHKVFSKKKRLFNHFRTHTGEKPYACDTCEKKFTNRSALTRHMRVHTGEKPFVCGVCNSQFTQSCSLKTHLMDVHMGNDAYVCNICNESFSKKHSFLTHSRIHKGEKPYVCPLCGEGFSRERDMRKHQLLHYDESVM